jgi:anthranilate phosphoribosyltransferase
MKVVKFLPVMSMVVPVMAFAQAPTPPVKHPICISGTDIESTSVPDDNTIVYHLRNGQVWKNTLKATCPQLKFEHAFTEVIRGGEICANAQMIRVHETGSICALGDFTLVSTAPKNR